MYVLCACDVCAVRVPECLLIHRDRGQPGGDRYWKGWWEISPLSPPFPKSCTWSTTPLTPLGPGVGVWPWCLCEGDLQAWSPLYSDGLEEVAWRRPASLAAELKPLGALSPQEAGWELASFPGAAEQEAQGCPRVEEGLEALG